MELAFSTYFKRSEFECSCGCGFDTVDSELLEVLEDVRYHFSKPVIITSACRCLKHNKAIGSTDRSQHTKGRAADIVVKDMTPQAVHRYLVETYKGKYGIGAYSDFTHIDTRSGVPARWEG
jgi:uncharacterized protein YcbK (DUF882 family)